MTTAFPSSLDNFTNPASGDGLAGHAQKHTDLNDAIEAIESTLLLTYVAAVDIGGHRIVTLDATSKLIYADNTILAHARKVLGITTGATSLGAAGFVVVSGEISEPSWSWTPELPVYLGTNGLLTQSVPVSGFSLVVGFAITVTKIFVSLREPLVIN